MYVDVFCTVVIDFIIWENDERLIVGKLWDGGEFELEIVANLMSQTPSADAKDPATSSDSIEDLATSAYFLDA